MLSYVVEAVTVKTAGSDVVGCVWQPGVGGMCMCLGGGVPDPGGGPRETLWVGSGNPVSSGSVPGVV